VKFLTVKRCLASKGVTPEPLTGRGRKETGGQPDVFGGQSINTRIGSAKPYSPGLVKSEEKVNKPQVGRHGKKKQTAPKKGREWT